jgi:hypothetical protein
MIITIQEKQFDTKEITQLYPAALVKTGFEDETTQVSLEWLDSESNGKVEVAGFGIFVHLGETQKEHFFFESRAEMDAEIARISLQLRSCSQDGSAS